MILAEGVLSLWLLSGRRLPQAALWAAFLHSAFFIWSTVALIRGLEIENCGCFGVFWARPLTPSILVEDGIMIAFSIALFVVNSRSCEMRP